MGSGVQEDREMREIKSKLWCKSDREWYEDFAITQDGEILLSVAGDEWVAPGRDNFEVVFFTGLKDKNGKECYSKDLFKCGDKVYRIEWIDEYLTFCPFTEQEWRWYQNGSNHFKYCWDDEEMRAGKRHFLSQFESWEIEVIGNIYENSVLLENKQLDTADA